LIDINSLAGTTARAELVPTQRGLPAIIDGSGRKARDRIEHFLRAAIDNDNTRRAYGRSLGSFFVFLEDGGRERVQNIGPLDVRDYLEAAKANGLSTATLKQHMAAIRTLFDHLVTGGVLEHNPALSVKAPRQKLGKGKSAGYASTSPSLHSQHRWTRSPFRSTSRHSHQVLRSDIGPDLFNHLVGAQKDRFWHGEAERFRGLKIDNQLELCRLFHRQVSWTRALDDLVDID
jgi:hypothetical protein